MNVPLFLRLRGSESDIASVKYHMHYAAESALTALYTLFPPSDIEVPDSALHQVASEDEEYIRLSERAKITFDRVRDRVRPDVAEHLEEALRAERERGERLVLLAYRVAIGAISRSDA